MAGCCVISSLAYLKSCGVSSGVRKLNYHNSELSWPHREMKHPGEVCSSLLRSLSPNLVDKKYIHIRGATIKFTFYMLIKVTIHAVCILDLLYAEG